MLHLLRSHLRRLRKTPSVPLLWLAFPIALSVIEYFAFGQVSGQSGIPRGQLLFVDQDRTLVSGVLRSAFQRQPLSDFFEVVNEEDESRIRKTFEDNKASAALVVPAGLADSVLAGGHIDLVFVPNPRQYIRPQMIEASLLTFFEIANRALHEAEGVFRQMRGMPAGEPTRESVLTISGAFYDVGQRLTKMRNLNDLKLDVERPVPEPEHPARSGDSLSFFTYFLPGLLLFSLLMVGQGFERRFFQDRRRGLARRIAASPVPRRNVLAAEAVGALMGVLSVAAIVLGLGKVLFKIRMQQPGVILLVLLGFSLLVVGLVKMLYARARSERAAGTLASVVILMNSLIGGGFVPVEVFSDSVRPLARLTPVGSASQGLVDALVHGKTVAETMPSIAVTWGWALVFGALAFVISRRAYARP